MKRSCEIRRKWPQLGCKCPKKGGQTDVEYRVHYDANGKPDAVRISRISIPNLEVIHPLVELSGEWNGSFSVDYASNFQIGDWRRGILEKDPETGDGRWTADFGGIVEVKVAESPICSILVLY